MNIKNLENNERKYVSSLGNFHVLEYQSDASVAPENARNEYFMSKMGVRRRQIVIELNGKESAIIQAGSMQWMAGHVKATTGIKGVGDFCRQDGQRCDHKGDSSQTGIRRQRHSGVRTYL